MDRSNRPPRDAGSFTVPILLALGSIACLLVVGGITVQWWMARSIPASIDPHEAYERSPDDPEAVRDLAWLLIDSDSADKAIGMARRAVELEPTNAESHLVVGAALQGQGRLGEATASLNEALRLDPDNAYVHYYLAGGYSRERRWEESEAEARRAIALDSTIARAHGLLAAALARRFEWKAAEAAVREGLRHESDDAYLYDVLGEVLRNTARPREAIDAYAKAAELEPDRPGAWLEIGVLEHILGDYEASVEALEKAQSLDRGYFAQRTFERAVLEASREGHQYEG